MEAIKRLAYQTRRANCYFYRTQNGVEVDLIIDKDNELRAYEIKFSKTISRDMAKGIKMFQKDHEIKNGYVLSLNKDNVPLGENIFGTHWGNILNEK